MKKFCVFLCMFMAGCATGFDRSDLNRRLSQQVKISEKDAEIESLFERRPLANLPVKVAIALNTSHWNEDDKNKILAVGDELVSQGVATDVVLLPQMVMADRNLRTIRLAAARYQADVVFVISSINDLDRYYNPLSVLYITIVGAWVIPGSHIDSLYIAEGTLFDVRNEYIYFSVHAEGEGSTWGPGAIIEANDAIKRAKTRCVEKFATSLREQSQKILLDTIR
ncbi:hypothetical protein [Candidatus Uabimicrobium amorphum]|uniref:Rhombotarget lipoprotein n=1 Tax=Uabimicrobium amorphum TaxID=2596890 RepID=A0A5S9IIP1_UABAM|nr:hypothetical protein [Candidatus Uabimicrobium amorphum]BBM82578.1 rhombotarget lipoprotein [Candidatus Uabimicrobium amorphum]